MKVSNKLNNNFEVFENLEKSSQDAKNVLETVQRILEGSPNSIHTIEELKKHQWTANEVKTLRSYVAKHKDDTNANFILQFALRAGQSSDFINYAKNYGNKAANLHELQSVLKGIRGETVSFAVPEFVVISDKEISNFLNEKIDLNFL